MEYLVIGLGGFLGANARYVVAGWAAQRFGSTFPAGTMIINVTGSFIIGLILVALGVRSSASPYYRLFSATVFLGAYTSCRTLVYEALLLLQQQNWSAAALNIGASVALGLLGVTLGALVGRIL